jgi:hypothetical protein
VSRRAAVAAAVLACAALAGCGDGSDPSGSASGRSGSSTTRSSTTVTTEAEVDGTLLTDDDAVLVEVREGRVRDVDPEDPCAALVDGGACGVAGDLAWVVRPDGAAERSPVTVHVVEGGSATPVLAVEREARAEYGAAHVEVADLDGTAGDELVVGLRNAGTGALLQLEVVDGTGRVVAHVTLDRGRAVLDGGGLRTWAARYGPDDPNCCPSRFDAARVVTTGDRWSSVPGGEVAPADVPPGDFP